MTVYALFIREGEIFNQAEMDIYSKMNREGPRNPDLLPLAVYGRMEVLEGEAPDGIVLLQFPDMEAAKAWYDSPAYQAAAEHRKQGANYRAVFFEGLS
jgi:uncharacterized protein (DUF1330 family)